METTTQLRSTPLLRQHQNLGAKLVPFSGYELPIQYSGIVKEHNAVRQAAGLFDVSHMGELWVRGSEAVPFVDHIVTNDLLRISAGQAMYTPACREHGGIVDDLIVYKHDDETVLIVCNASNRAKVWDHLGEQAQGFLGLSLQDESDATGLLALQGPNWLKVLGDCAPGLSGDIGALKSFRHRSGTLLGHDVTVARTGYTGEDGIELFCQNEALPELWEALMAAGARHGLLPVGLGARDTLRLEARLSLYGNELDEQTNPLEAGLGWTVKMKKPNFLGKDALASSLKAGLEKQLVGFEVLDRGSARAGYPLLDPSGAALGKCTSGGPSPTLGKAIGLGYVLPSSAQIGSELAVECRGKKLRARVVETPFYRRPLAKAGQAR